VRERGERLDARLAQPLDLVAPHAGDERQVVVPLPAPGADGDEVAARAVLDRPGIEARGRRLEVLLQPPLRDPEEGVEVGRPVGLDDTGARHDVQPLGQPPLDPPDLLRVEDELEHGRRFPRPRELRVPGLVAPPAEVGRLVDADDEVGEPAPALAREDGLVDDLGAVAHRLLGERGGLVEVAPTEPDLDDLAALGLELGEVRPLVLIPLLGNQRRNVGARVRPGARAARDLELERRQIRAREVARQIGRRQEEPIVVESHCP
jgi:hypothetical protein